MEFSEVYSATQGSLSGYARKFIQLRKEVYSATQGSLSGYARKFGYTRKFIRLRKEVRLHKEVYPATERSLTSYARKFVQLLKKVIQLHNPNTPIIQELNCLGRRKIRTVNLRG